MAIRMNTDNMWLEKRIVASAVWFEVTHDNMY